MNQQRNLNSSIHPVFVRSVNPSASAFCWPRVGMPSYSVILLIVNSPLKVLTKVNRYIRAAFGVASYDTDE